MKEQILDPLRSTEIVDEIREEVSGMFFKKFLIWFDFAKEKEWKRMMEWPCRSADFFLFFFEEGKFFFVEDFFLVEDLEMVLLVVSN